MAYPTTLDTLTDGSLGRVKSDNPAIVLGSLDHDVPAAEYNLGNAAIAKLEEYVGVEDNSTANSLRWRIARMRSGEVAASSLVASGTLAEAEYIEIAANTAAVTADMPSDSGLWHDILVRIAPSAYDVTLTASLGDINGTGSVTIPASTSARYGVLLGGIGDSWYWFEVVGRAEIGERDGSTASSLWRALLNHSVGWGLYSTPPQTIGDAVHFAVLYTSGGTFTLPPQPTDGTGRILRILAPPGSYYDLQADAGDTTPTIDGAPGATSYPIADSTVTYTLSSIGNGWTTLATVRSPVIVDVAAASTTLATAETTTVSYAAGTCTLTLPDSVISWPIGETRSVTKANTSTYGIVLAPNVGGSINGGAANAAMTLPGSTRPCSTTTPNQRWPITRTSTTTWIVAGGDVRYDTSGNVDLGAGNLATSGTVDGRDVSVDGAKLDLITSGSWVPTFGTFTNLDSVTNIQSDYIRVGTRVMCFCTWAVDPTASGAIQFNFSLPIASNFTTTSQLVGNAGVNAVAVAMYGDIAADQGVVNYGGNTSTTVANYRAIFGYDIV